MEAAPILEASDAVHRIVNRPRGSSQLWTVRVNDDAAAEELLLPLLVDDEAVRIQDRDRRIAPAAARQATPLSLYERESLVTDVLNELFGLGPLEELLEDPDISDILIEMREVKTPEELALWRRAYVYFDRAHAFARDYILTHGTDGAVKLGETWLSMDNLGGHSGDLAHWGWSLKADADLLFYGCDLAESEDGQMLVETLSKLTGADVAASVADHLNVPYTGEGKSFL